MKELRLHYKTPAEDSAKGWENESLPIGNGYLGANIFGIAQRERIQITENSLQNPAHLGGLNNFLTSYPDKILAVKLTASRAGALSFVLAPEIPYVKDYAKEPGDGGGKTGEVTSLGDTIKVKGKMLYYNILFEGQIKVITESGSITADHGTIRVDDADSAVILFAAGTNYNLHSTVFLENDPKKKLSEIDPHDKVSKMISDASQMDYALLKERHIADYRNLFGRVSLAIDGEHTDLHTDEMLQKYREGPGEGISGGKSVWRDRRVQTPQHFASMCSVPGDADQLRYIGVA